MLPRPKLFYLKPKERLADIAADTAHQMTHEPKNEQCEVCLNAKVQRRQKRAKTAGDMGPEPHSSANNAPETASCEEPFAQKTQPRWSCTTAQQAGLIASRNHTSQQPTRLKRNGQEQAIAGRVSIARAPRNSVPRRGHAVGVVIPLPLGFRRPTGSPNAVFAK